MLVDNQDKCRRRIDFLIWRSKMLVVTHYMYMESRKLIGFVLNKSVEKIVESDILHAKQIVLQDIVSLADASIIWKVASQSIVGRWYDIPEPYTQYACCSFEWSIRGNMYKHQLAILKVSTNLSWSVILEFLGTFYGSLRGGLDVMFKHQVSQDLFGDFGYGGDSRDDDDDDGDAKVIVELMVTEYGFQNAILPTASVEEPQPSMERLLGNWWKKPRVRLRLVA